MISSVKTYSSISNSMVSLFKSDAETAGLTFRSRPFSYKSLNFISDGFYSFTNKTARYVWLSSSVLNSLKELPLLSPG